MTQQQPAKGMRVFTAIWAGQLVSMVGSGLTGFALGVWVFQETQSVTLFSFILIATMLPGILLAPIAGVMVDRWDRRWTMIWADTGAAICTAAVAILLYFDALQIWHIYIIVTISAMMPSFHFPAYTAATTMLVPQEQLGRVGGLNQVARAVSQLLPPLLAGVLLVQIDLWGVLLVDLVTFVVAVVVTLSVRIPNPERSAEAGEKSSILKEATYGWKYIMDRPGLVGLLVFFIITNFGIGFTQVLLTPLVLSLASAAVLGTVVSVSGAGLLVGGLVMSSWGGPKRQVYGVLGFGLMLGLGMVITGLRPSIGLIMVGSFLIMFAAPIINASSQAIWQSKVAPDVQGRVFSTRLMIAWSVVPVSYFLAGALSDGVFNPLLVEGGALADNVGRVIGVGDGRGIGFMYLLLGFFPVLASVVGYLNPRLRLVEDELPDAVIKEAAEPEAEASELAEGEPVAEAELATD